MSERSLCLFVGHLFQAKLASQTVKCYLSAVRFAQIALGLGDPKVDSMPRLEYVTRGLKKSATQKKAPRLHITPPILRRLKLVWERMSNQHDALMLWAAACICFFGFLRSGEIVVPSETGYDQSSHLSFGDVRVDDRANPQYLEIHLKASKTDPFRQGVSVVVGRTNTDLCPVAAGLAYMAARGSAPGPLFKFHDGKFLTRDNLVKAVRSALSAAGVEAAHYSGHSFRIGAATTAFGQGVPDVLIKTMGRWESSAYMLYIRTPREQLCAVARSLAQ